MTKTITMKIELKKYDGNPILVPNPEIGWESQAVFNAGVIYHDGRFHMLYRAIGEYEHYISRLGYAVSEDGQNFRRVSKEAVLFPEHEYEQWGCEDSRIMELEGTIYVTYVALNKNEKGQILPLTALARTNDFFSYEKLGLINPAQSINKDTVLFPEKIGGRYMMIHRPHNWIQDEIKRENGRLMVKLHDCWLPWELEEEPDYFPEKPSIWAAYSDDLINWYGHQVMMEPKFTWEKSKIGGGCPPIRTEYGWLLIFHGVGHTETGNRRYCAGAALLDLEDPTRILCRLENPILAPECDYEIEGDVPRVVFPEGAVLFDDGRLFVYYGGGDKCVNLATGTVRFG
ncbi:MAG: glycosidase [bacterium]|nr:glycosidase [bacterium]